MTRSEQQCPLPAQCEGHHTRRLQPPSNNTHSLSELQEIMGVYELEKRWPQGLNLKTLFSFSLVQSQSCVAFGCGLLTSVVLSSGCNIVDCV